MRGGGEMRGGVGGGERDIQLCIKDSLCPNSRAQELCESRGGRPGP